MRSTSVRFVDTNVLLYAISTDAGERRKAEIATALLDDPDLALSTQVLQEFYVQATRTSRPGAIEPHQAAALLESFSRFEVQPVTLDVVRVAITLCDRYCLSYWDSAILAAAKASGCETVLSEDLADGQRYGTVTVVNPFTPASAT